MANFKSVGTWWNDKGIDLVEIDSTIYALHGWDGEKFVDCWVCSGEYNMDASDEKYEITPIHEENDGEFETVGYDVQ